jgi:primary-amine oxidase
MPMDCRGARRVLCATVLAFSLSSDAAPFTDVRPAAPDFPGEESPPGPAAGNLVRWEGWSFRWSVRRREGLVLTGVYFQGMSVLKYAGLAEIFVPYHPGRPRPEDFQDGMGNTLVELTPGKDCSSPAGCQALNAEGRAEGRRVVMMHEEPAGLAYMGRFGRAYGKVLVLWCMSRLSGYTYVTQWRFRDDGVLLPQIGLTGELEHTAFGDSSPQGSFVGTDPKGQKVFAPSHVHNFYYRLDFDIDGSDHNCVEEFNYRPDRPGGPGGRHAWTPLRTECRREANAAAFRSWRVVNRASRNALGHPRSYELVPGGNGTFRGASAEAFAQAELWVTRFHPYEFPFSGADPRPLKTALPAYLNGESVDGADVVLWYVLHVHHVPRTEDYPAMPIDWVGFHLAPRDFLDASPLKPQER